MRKTIQETFNSAIEEAKKILPPPKKKPHINDPFSTPLNKTCNPKHITSGRDQGHIELFHCQRQAPDFQKNAAVQDVARAIFFGCFFVNDNMSCTSKYILCCIIYKRNT